MSTSAITEYEAAQVDRANTTGRAPANVNPWTQAKVDTRNPDRGHALTIDSGRREIADTALAFVRRFTPAETTA